MPGPVAKDLTQATPTCLDSLKTSSVWPFWKANLGTTGKQNECLSFALGAQRGGIHVSYGANLWSGLAKNLRTSCEVPALLEECPADLEIYGSLAKEWTEAGQTKRPSLWALEQFPKRCPGRCS